MLAPTSELRASETSWFTGAYTAASVLPLQKNASTFLCRFVIHTACPLIMGVPAKRAYERLVGPAVHGTQNVLRSVNRSSTVEKGG